MDSKAGVRQDGPCVASVVVVWESMPRGTGHEVEGKAGVGKDGTSVVDVAVVLVAETGDDGDGKAGVMQDGPCVVGIVTPVPQAAEEAPTVIPNA